ncbi:hypothetical protein H9649_17420 [Sporosarcina sp. Sa2YVA2]|uniref:DUF4352 domain-containing protein n=1 Tax=Sporosarcina quadrami TaxID=2762234 RepID=A0ABR8UF29_9BACL|nr:hypothetical protein [Sporosarcina quadrami]MBD7986353.1 hypothetical protein [Sporosarcina quadrami]
MRSWRFIVILMLVLIVIGLISFLIGTKSQKQSLNTYVIGDAKVEIFIEENNYQPVLIEGSVFKKKTSVSPIYRNNKDVYFDYTVINIGDFDFIVGAVQSSDVEKVVFQTTALKIEKEVDSDKLFGLLLPSGSVEHPIIILKQGLQVQYPYKKIP